jgi:hypothetical protein
MTVTTTLELSLQPKTDGSGYTLIYRTASSTTGSGNPTNGNCPQTTFNTMVQADSPFWDLWTELRDAVVATELPCGG